MCQGMWPTLVKLQVTSSSIKCTPDGNSLLPRSNPSLASLKGLRAYKSVFLSGSIFQLPHNRCSKELALNKTGTLQRDAGDTSKEYSNTWRSSEPLSFCALAGIVSTFS